MECPLKLIKVASLLPRSVQDHHTIMVGSRLHVIFLCIIMSHSLLWRHIVLLMAGVYSSNHRVLYTIRISMTRRFKKSAGPPVRPSVCLSVCNANKKAYSSFIIGSRKIYCISGEKAYHPLQENEEIFSKKKLDLIFETLGICINIPAPLSLLTVE